MYDYGSEISAIIAAQTRHNPLPRISHQASRKYFWLPFATTLSQLVVLMTESCSNL
jgi:hypothetical protein